MGDGEERAHGFKFGVLVFEVGLGSEVHLLQLGGGDGVEAGAVKRGFAVFDFGEEDVVVFYGDEVDFVEMGFVVLFDESVALLLEISSDE